MQRSMNRYRALVTFSRYALLLALLVFFFGAELALGQSSIDRIRRKTGVDTGQITKITALGATIKKNGVEKTVPVEQIESIYFAGEPSQVSAARQALKRNEPESALESIKKIDRSSLGRDEIVQEIDYLGVLAQRQLATRGKSSLRTAVQSAEKFLSAHRTSYHISDVIEVLGSAQLASGESEAALVQFRKLAKAPGAYFQARSAILIGTVLQQQGKHDQAVVEFDKALAASKGDAGSRSERQRATLYRAVSQSALGAAEEAAEIIREIISEADRSDSDLLAVAYNALGDCYLENGKQSAARDAFLHVDILFSSESEQHAKALYELTKIWASLGRDERAREAKQRLHEKYPASRWARL